MAENHSGETPSTNETAPRAQWSVEAENGTRCYASQDVAEAVAAGDNDYTMGSGRSPLVRAYTRPHPDADWEPLRAPLGAPLEEG